MSVIGPVSPIVMKAVPLVQITR